MKPIIVCGIDFSGTSMVAGLLHAAGIDMGDVESAEDVAASDRPIRYRTFEDKTLRTILAPTARLMLGEMPVVSSQTIESISNIFTSYAKLRNERTQGRRWGVKCNGLLFLAMYEGIDPDLFEWVTTYRPFEESLESCRQKLGQNERYQMMMEAEYTPHHFLLQDPDTTVMDFHKLLEFPTIMTSDLLTPLGYGMAWPDAYTLINPYTKGVIPCHGSLPAACSSAR